MKNKKLDPKTHDDILKKRFFSFVLLLLILTVITTIGILPFFIVPFAFVAVFLALVFQVFMLEDKISPVGAIKRSIYLVKGNYWVTMLLLLLSFAITYWLIPSLFVWLFKEINLFNYLTLPIKTYIDVLAVPTIVSAVESALSSIPLGDFNISYYVEEFFDQLLIEESILTMIIMASVTWFLLPLRCAWFTLLYKMFDCEKTDELRKNEAKREK